jgi:hypothetical protein
MHAFHVQVKQQHFAVYGLSLIRRERDVDHVGRHRDVIQRGVQYHRVAESILDAVNKLLLEVT